MTGTDTGFHDKANGAFFPLVHGMELRRVQRRFLASLLRQPGVVPTVLTTGIGPDDFPEAWRHAFIMAMKGPGRAKQILADPNGDPTIRHLYTHQIVCWDMGAPDKWRSRLSPVFDGGCGAASRRSLSQRHQQLDRRRRRAEATERTWSQHRAPATDREFAPTTTRDKTRTFAATPLAALTTRMTHPKAPPKE